MSWSGFEDLQKTFQSKSVPATPRHDAKLSTQFPEDFQFSASQSNSNLKSEKRPVHDFKKLFRSSPLISSSISATCDSVSPHKTVTPSSIRKLVSTNSGGQNPAKKLFQEKIPLNSISHQDPILDDVSSFSEGDSQNQFYGFPESSGTCLLENLDRGEINQVSESASKHFQAFLPGKNPRGIKSQAGKYIKNGYASQLFGLLQNLNRDSSFFRRNVEIQGTNLKSVQIKLSILSVKVGSLSNILHCAILQPSSLPHNHAYVSLFQLKGSPKLPHLAGGVIHVYPPCYILALNCEECFIASPFWFSC
eukprot:Sdes_comp19356_c0_seq1m10593